MASSGMSCRVVTSQKTPFFTVTAVKTSNLTKRKDVLQNIYDTRSCRQCRGAKGVQLARRTGFELRQGQYIIFRIVQTNFRGQPSPCPMSIGNCYPPPRGVGAENSSLSLPASKSSPSMVCLLHVDFLLDIHFDTDDGGNVPQQRRLPFTGVDKAMSGRREFP
jgi:hypothetical protein